MVSERVRSVCRGTRHFASAVRECACARVSALATFKTRVCVTVRRRSYIGKVFAVKVTGPDGALATQPTLSSTFAVVDAATGAWGGGIWGLAGVALYNGLVYTATGNTINSENEWDQYGERVVQLEAGTLLGKGQLAGWRSLDCWPPPQPQTPPPQTQKNPQKNKKFFLKKKKTKKKKKKNI